MSSRNREPTPRPVGPDLVAFRVGGVAMRLITHSDLYRDPRRFDGGTRSAREAQAALLNAHCQAVGSAESWVVRASRIGALVIAEECENLRDGRKSARTGQLKRESSALRRAVRGIVRALDAPTIGDRPVR